MAEGAPGEALAEHREVAVASEVDRAEEVEEEGLQEEVEEAIDRKYPQLLSERSLN